MNEIEELIKKYNHIFSNSVPDMLDDPFSRGEDSGSGRVSHEMIEDLKRLQRSLQSEQGLTEQQALNKLAERFPMTTNQIVSTLEMSQVGVTHEPVEVPKFVDYLIKKCRRESNDITLYGFIKVNSDKGFRNNQSKEGEFVIWLTKKGNEELLARAWFDGYTVAKEPLYIISKPLEANEIFKNYFTGFVGGLEPLMDCRKKEAYKFSDFEQAKAVAFLICGNVEEEE